MLRQFFRFGYVGVVLGHRGKWRHVIHFLVGVAPLVTLLLAPGDGDNRRTSQPGILQARRQVDRANRLRHAQPRRAPDAGIGIRHISGGFLAAGLYTLDAQFFHFH